METVYEDFKDSVSYKRYLFVLRIAEYAARVTGNEKSEVIRKVARIRDELDLHELELVLFFVYLEKFEWSGLGDKEQALWFIAYAAKNFLNEFSSEFEERLKEKFGFFNGYRDWIYQFRSIGNVGYADLNMTYNKLCRADVACEEVDPFDYNYAVTQLIETSTRAERS
jgi:hypothetical protein